MAVALLGLSCARNVSESELLQRGQEAQADGNSREAMIHMKNLLRKNPQNTIARAVLGLALLNLGEFDAAATELDKALRQGVDPGLIGHGIVRARLGAGQFQAALEQLDELAKKNGSVDAHLSTLRGETLVGLRRLDDARTAFQQALTADADHVPAMIGSARLAAERGDETEAGTFIERVLEVDPSSSEAAFLQAQLSMRAGRFADARDGFASLAERLTAPSRTRQQRLLAVATLGALAESHFAMGDAAEAANAVKRLEAIAPTSRTAMILRARVDFAERRLDAARTSLEKLVNADANDANSRMLLSAVMLAQGNMEQAEMHLSSLVAADPRNVVARRLLAEARLREQKPRAALEAIEPVLSGGAADALAFDLAGRSALAIGDADRAIRYLEESVQASPTSINTALALAAAHLSAGNTARTLQLLEAVEPADPLSSNRRDALIIGARVRAGNTNGAVAAIDSMLARPNRDIPSVLIAAEAYLLLDRAADASELIRRELKSRPDAPELVLASAALYIRASQWDAAEIALKRYRKLAPSAPYGALGLAQVAAARNDHELAHKWLQTAVDENPKALEPRLQLLRFQLGAEQYAAARVTAEAGLETAPENGALLNALGLSLARLGRSADAAKVFEKLAASARESPRHVLAAARGFALLEQWASASTHARRAAALAPTDFAIVGGACALVVSSDNANDAMSCIADLKKLDPQRAQPWMLEGDVAMRRSAYRAAERAYDAARAREDSASLAIRLFEARRRGGTPPSQATQPLESWLERHPRDRAVRMVLAQQRLDAGDRQAARVHYETLLADQPNHAVSLNNLAWIYHESGDSRALSLAARAYGVAPERGEIADTYGWLLLQSGEVGRARDLLQKAANALPSSADVQYHFAVALSRNGQTRQALMVLERILSSMDASPAIDEARKLHLALSSRPG